MGINLGIIIGLFGVEYHGSAGKSVAQFYTKNWGFPITNSLRRNVIPGGFMRSERALSVFNVTIKQNAQRSKVVT